MFSREPSDRVSKLLILSLIVVAVVATVVKAEDKDDADFADRARKLDPSNPQKDRLDALEWLETLHSLPAAGEVMPDVERCLKKDADAAVRAKAATVLGLIAYKRKPSVCPLSVVEALRDGDKDVREGALDVASLFRDFAPGAVDILLRCAGEGDRDMRAGVLTVLVAAGGREDKVRKFLRHATTDRDFLIRNNAHAALFSVTGELEDIVPHCIRVQLEFTNLPPLAPGASEENKTDQSLKHLVQWGMLSRLHELEASRGEELAKLVLGQLNQPSGRERRAAAFLIGEYPALLEKLRHDAPSLTVVRAEKKPKGDAPPPPGLLHRLRSMKVGDSLGKLAKDDPDEQVRAAAAAALEKLGGRKEKRP